MLLCQVCYNAQMIRTWSLLLRSAQRAGYVVAGRQDATPLSEHPFLIHPVETGAAACAHIHTHTQTRTRTCTQSRLVQQ